MSKPLHWNKQDLSLRSFADFMECRSEALEMFLSYFIFLKACAG